MIELIAPAKLTWYLEITGVRGDGLHELRSEMTTLDLADRLLVDLAEDYVALANVAPVPLDETNLVARALRLVDTRAGVVIEKNIPVGGGLGGGSADAAAILRFFGGVSDDQAASLGGDVPFCQHGGRALVEGVGERVTPLAFEAREVTLMMPGFSVSTRDCYAAFDELGPSAATRRGPNDLETAACAVEPRLASTLAWLRANYGDGVQLAGSGSTMFLAGHVEGPASAWDVTGPEGTVRFRHSITTPA
ncbi:MAG: 4-(cytidine 5'-diphospho)-2-C-methyl-D-erythritol kinase [Acidimicrobiales bacterium]|jgi:4-diphosphocytidyl-2-C-methyl-D-erythritol kinase